MIGAWLGGAMLLTCLLAFAGATVLVMAILIVGGKADKNWHEHEADSIGEWSSAELDTLMAVDDDDEEAT